MSCEGICNLCHLLRDGQCQCFRRGGRIVDSVHPTLTLAESYIETERFFGRAKRDVAFELIDLERRTLLSHVASGQVDGRELRQFDKDAERLKVRANGKVFATAQMMAEAQQSTKTETRIKREHSERALDGFLARRAKAQSPAT